jgi:REP element-mobilizing transposase RayT
MITHDRNPILGVVARAGIVLTDAGRIVHESWMMVPARFRGVHVDAFVVMPDHVHAIVFLLQGNCPPVKLGQVVGWTKQRASRAIASSASPCQMPIWQSSFHDRIIRDQDALARMRTYVNANPARAWEKARRSSERAGVRIPS